MKKFLLAMILTLQFVVVAAADHVPYPDCAPCTVTARTR
jgi:hypothetical protein